MAGHLQEKRERTPVSNHAVAVTAADWDAVVLGSDRPVLVDFWAAWCPPCRRVAPAVETLAAALAGAAVVAKLDVDANPEVARRYGVVTIPSFLVFVGGREVSRTRGALPEPQLRALLETHLAPAAADSPGAGGA